MPQSFVLKARLSLAIVSALASPAAFDAGRLRTGRFSYDVRNASTVVATGVLQVARNTAGEYAFDGTFTASVCQHRESVAARTFAPRSAMLQFCKDGTERRVFELAYARSRVTGVRHVGAPPQVEPRPVEASLVDVPAGRFRAYRVADQKHKPTGDEPYQSLVTVGTPRMLLAITFPNGTTSRLLEHQ